MTIRAWLETLGLAQYADQFEAQDIDTELLAELDHDTLRELGVGTLGHRLKMLRAARARVPGAGSDDAQPEASDPAGEIAPRTSWEAERRQLTIMFAELVGSTTLSTRMDPEDFRNMIRIFHEEVAAAATEGGGHVAQYLGDGALVYFGYPVAQEDAAQRSVSMGFRLIEAAGRLTPFPGEQLQLRVGIATGLVVVGDVVGRGGMNEGAVVSGETPNLAARLQSLAEPNSIVVSDMTHQLLGRAFRTERLDPQRLKGFDEAQTVWRIVGEAGVEDRFDAHRGGRLSPLVGRKAEMTRLVESWEAARAGHGRTVLLRGEAGLGKSRLLRELSTTARGSTAVQLQCSPYFANSSLHPVRRAIEQLAGLERDDDTETRLNKVLRFFRLDRSVPSQDGALLAAFMGLPTERFPDVTISVAMQRTRLFQVIVHRIRTAAERVPFMFFFEDMHWADPTSVEFLGLLIEAAPGCPLLIVATFRPEFELPWAPDEHVVLCDMERLNRAEIGEIIAHLSGSVRLPPELAQALAERADGVPLFVEELTKSVIEAPDVGSGGNAAAVPATLLDTLMARLDRMVTTRGVAQVASVIGREFDEDLLAAIAERPIREIHHALEMLESAELVVRTGQAGVWAFHHTLIRDAAYDSLLRRSRQDLHLRIARGFEQLFPDRVATEPEFVARHFGEAGDAGQSARHWLAAGRLARQRGATKEALAHVLAGLEQAQRMTPSSDRDTLSMQLEMTRGYILFAGVGYASPEAEAAFARAAELSASVTDPDVLTPFYNGYGVHKTMRGDITGGHAELSKLIDVAREAPRLAIYAAATQAWSLFNRGEFAASVGAGDELQALFAESNWDPRAPRHTTGDPYVIGRCFHGASLWSLGYPDRAAAVVEQTLAYARTLNDPFSEIYAQVNGVCRVADLRGEPARVLEVSSEAIDFAKRLGYDFAAGYSLFWQARALAATGKRDKAIVIIQAALAACKAASVRYHEPHFRAMLAVLQAEGGDPEAAGATLEGLEELVETSGERWQAVDVRCARAQVAERAGDDETAEAAWRAALAIARDQGAPSWELRAAIGLAALLVRRDAAAEARDILTRARGGVVEGAETADVRRAEEMLTMVA